MTPGLNWVFGPLQVFWNETYTAMFSEIMKRNFQKVLLTVGGHIHTLDFRFASFV